MKDSKTFLLILFLTFNSIYSFSQKTEFNINIYSGLFYYRGSGATSISQIENGFKYYTTDVYGKKSAFSVSYEGQVIKRTKKDFLFGIGLSYDFLNSNVIINKVVYNGDYLNHIYDAHGNTKLKNTYINVNPFVGKRLIKNKITFDLLAGVDLGFCLTSNEKGSAITTISKIEYSADNKRDKPEIDFRPRVQIKAGYRRGGIILGYSLGLTNYQTLENTKAYSNFFRAGISYKLK